MTPQDKAVDLIGKMCAETFEESKQCALVAVDEILQLGWNLPHYENKTGIEYWQQVKEVLEKL